MTYERGRNDWHNIQAEAMDPAAEPVEVTEELYDEMLNAVPPYYVPGGFLVGEPLTDCSLGTVYVHFARREDRFFARYSVGKRPETYIPLHYKPPVERCSPAGASITL